MGLRNILINFVLLTVSAFFGVGTIVLWNRFTPPKTSPEIHARQLEAMRAKVHLDKVSGVLVPNKTNVILFLKVSCRWCKESMPLYKDMLNSSSIMRGATVTAILPDSSGSASAYLAANKLSRLHTISNTPLEKFGISGTPTMLVMRGNKLVEGWDGYQRNSEEVIQAVTKIVKESK